MKNKVKEYMKHRKAIPQLVSEFSKEQKQINKQHLSTLKEINEEIDELDSSFASAIQRQEDHIDYLYDEWKKALVLAKELKEENIKLTRIVNKFTSAISPETLDRIILELNDGVDVYDEYIDYLNGIAVPYNEQQQPKSDFEQEIQP